MCCVCFFAQQHTIQFTKARWRLCKREQRTRYRSDTLTHKHANGERWQSGELIWLAEKGVWGSILGLATWISEIGYLLLPSRDMAETLIKRRNPKTTEPTTIGQTRNRADTPSQTRLHDVEQKSCNNVKDKSFSLHRQMVLQLLIFIVHCECVCAFMYKRDCVLLCLCVQVWL